MFRHLLHIIVFYFLIPFPIFFSNCIDGDNLGSDVIETLVSTVGYAVDSLTSFTKEYTTFRIARAKLAVRICCAPHNEDLRSSFHASDLDMFYNLRQTFAAIIDVFVATYDALGKNMEKVKHPRSREQQPWMF